MADSEYLHLIFVDEGEYGITMTSPQVPGLAYATPSAQVDRDDVNAALKFAQAPDLPIASHSVRRFTSPDGIEFSVRVASDANRKARTELATAFLRVVTAEEQSNSILAQPSGPIPEIQFVCVLPTDSIGWVIDQMDERGDTIVLVSSVAGELVWALPMATHRNLDSWTRLELPREALVSDLMLRTKRTASGALEPVLVDT